MTVYELIELLSLQPQAAEVCYQFIDLLEVSGVDWNDEEEKVVLS